MIETLQEDAPLERLMEGDAEMVPHHEREEDRSRRTGVLGHVPRHGGGDGGDASTFDGALDQRDALMADGSGRRGECDVGPFRRHCRRDVLRERPLQPLRVHVVADERVEVVREPTDHPFRHELP